MAPGGKTTNTVVDFLGKDECSHSQIINPQ